MTKPSIILITTDQHRADCYGYAGQKVITPFVDKLARSGTVFTQCVTPSLVCQPARASILTGLLPTTHGVLDNGIDLPRETGELGFSGRLKELGYNTAMIGKAHFATQSLFEGRSSSPECKAFSSEIAPDWRGPYMGFNEVELLCFGHDMIRLLRPPQGLHYERWFFADGQGEERLLRHAQNSSTKDRSTHPFESLLPVEWHHSTWIADRAIAYLKNSSDDPICLWISFPDPHYPFDAPLPFSRLHDVDSIELPHHWQLDLDRRPWWHKAFIEGQSDPILEIRNYGLKLLSDSSQAHYLRQMKANYFGMISLVDSCIGRILDSLKEFERYDNTFIFLTADHGDLLGDHGFVLKGPMAYEGLLCVPMVCRGPGIPAGRTVSEPVSTLDLCSTFGEIANSQWNDQEGKSLLSLAQGGSERRSHARSEWDMGTFDNTPEIKLRTVRTSSAKLTMELNSGVGELYDLSTDPHEMMNLFGSQLHIPLQRSLMEMILQGNTAEHPQLPRIGWA